jgi:hypothetical protein
MNPYRACPVVQPSSPRAEVAWICLASDGEPHPDPYSLSEALLQASQYNPSTPHRDISQEPASSRLGFLQTRP